MEKRLGSGAEGAGEVKKHPFFREIDWKALESKQIEPPFKPKVRSSSCINNFDVAFTNEVPTDSLPEGSVVTDNKDTHFDEFTFVAEVFIT